MDNYEPGIYTEGVLKAVAVLRDQGNIYTHAYRKFVKKSWFIHKSHLYSYITILY